MAWGGVGAHQFIFLTSSVLVLNYIRACFPVMYVVVDR